MGNKITANNAKIVQLQAKAKAAEAKDEDASGYYAEIEALEAENKELEAKIEEYNKKLEEENKIYNELGNYWNAYNRVSGGLNSAFAAIDGMDKLSRLGADADLYGLALTAEQKKQLFNNLGNTVSSLKGELSDVFNKKGDYRGGLTASQIDFIVAGCSILGKIGTDFGANLNTFKEFNNAASAAGGFDKMDPATIEKFTGTDNAVTKQDGTNKIDTPDVDTGKEGLSADSTADKDKLKGDGKGSNKDLAAIDPAKAVLATLDGCKLAVQYTSLYKAKSDVVMDAVVEEFMTNNAGKMVLLDNSVRKALGLQTRGYINIPKAYNTEEAFPFLYWLTGTGFASVGDYYLQYEPLAKRLLAGNYRNGEGIIYIPTGWGSGSTQENNSTYNGTMLNHDLHQFMKGLNIDKDRLSCAGSSVGAYAAAYLVTRNPNVFSAVAMTGGGFGGPWGNVSVNDAIKNSPETSFIWYIANNDYTSHDRAGNGVRDYTYAQHQKMQAAGMNSVYYEIGGMIGHTYACDRFPNAKMFDDLFAITKGEKYDCPSGIVKLSSQQSVDAVLGNNKNTWYHSLAA